MGDSPKWVKSRRRRRKKKRERAKVGDNNGQATHGARKHAWRTQAALAKNCIKNGYQKKSCTLYVHLTIITIDYVIWLSKWNLKMHVLSFFFYRCISCKENWFSWWFSGILPSLSFNCPTCEHLAECSQYWWSDSSYTHKEHQQYHGKVLFVHFMSGEPISI